MQSSDDVTISSLLAALRQDTERSRAAWSQLREILREEPEQVAAPLFSWLDEALASGATVPVQADIILAVEACTKRQPDLIPEEVARRLLSRAEQLDHLSLLCLAAVLARLRPDRIITEGILQVLVATESALTEPVNESDRQVREYARGVALDLWHTVAARDPASLVALLNAWVANAGWQRHSSHLLAELLLEAAPLHPYIIDETIAVLEGIEATERQSPGELEPPDRILGKLRELGETFQHKTTAEQIVQEVMNEIPPPRSVPPAPSLRGASGSAPDVKVDRMIEEYLELPGYMKRMEEAERRLAQAMQSGSAGELSEEDMILAGSNPPGERLFHALSAPYPALVEGVCGLVDELLAADPLDERIGLLVARLCLALHGRPNLIPVDEFQRWVATDAAFDDQTKSFLYGLLATVSPDWIVEHRLADAVSVSIVAKTPGFLSDIGVYYPEFLRAFVERYLSEVEADWMTARSLTREMEKVARQHPEEAEAMVAVIERLRGEPPAPGVIDFRYTELSNTLDSLRSLGGSDQP